MFKNREEAGRRLVERLIRYRGDPTAIILALPRGGVAVGYQLSLGLHLPLDIFIARKLGAPDNPEYALGAVGETGTVHLNPEAMAEFHHSRSDLQKRLFRCSSRKSFDDRTSIDKAGDYLHSPTASSFSSMMALPPGPRSLHPSNPSDISNQAA